MKAKERAVRSPSTDPISRETFIEPEASDDEDYNENSTEDETDEDSGRDEERRVKSLASFVQK